MEDADHTPLVIDWRAPVAEPFYRATAIAPMGVVRRRHFITRHGREIAALDDEVFDRDATESAGLQVSGEGALLGALERDRTGRMGDIVATIQAEQDEAIRAELPGILVVGGGPGTGKTAVAAPRRVPPLHPPAPSRLAGRAARRAEPGVPPLHRAGAAVARRAGRAAHDDRRAQAAARLAPREIPDVAGRQGRRADGAVVAKAVGDQQRAAARRAARGRRVA